jgi:hypothetical protein
MSDLKNQAKNKKKSVEARQPSMPKPPRKKRKPLVPTLIDQAPTASAVYHGEVKRNFRGMRAIIVQIMESYGLPMTAAEIRLEYRRETGRDVPESTVFGQLHALFHAGVVTDRETEDRPCRVTRRLKKTWRLTGGPDDEPEIDRKQAFMKAIEDVLNDDADGDGREAEAA